MWDPYNRRIDYVRISVTDRCNLRCIYCMPRGIPSCTEGSGAVSREMIRAFLSVAVRHGVTKVRFTGGEPLLRSDIVEIVSDAKFLGVKDLSLTTNGVLLADMSATLKAAGLDRVNISLDTMDASTFRKITGSNCLEKVLESIRAAGEAGLTPIKINVVPIRGLNDGEIPLFAAMTVTGRANVRFIELMPVGDGAWSRKRRLTSAEARLMIESALGRMEAIGESGSSRNYRLKGAQGVIGFISPMSDHFCGTCNRLRVTSQGILKACLFSDSGISLKKAVSEDDIEQCLFELLQRKPEGKKPVSSLPYEAMSLIGG